MICELRYDENGYIDEVIADGEFIHIEQMSNSQSLILIGEGPRMTSIMAAAWYPRCIEWVLERLQNRFDWEWLDGPRLSLFVEEVGTGWTEKGDRHE